MPTPHSKPSTGARPATPWRVLTLLMAVTGIGSLCLNILAPAVPALAQALHTSAAEVQLTITLYLVGLGVSQLVLGPLSDRIGRRPVMIGGLALVSGASVLAIFASTIENLILLRVVQAFGAATGVVVGRAIIRDLVDRDRTASLIGLVTTMMIVSPLAAPLIGGILETTFGWVSIFIFMAALGTVLLVWTVVILPETLSPTTKSAGPGQVLVDLRALTHNPTFFCYAICGALSCAPFYVYLGGGAHAAITMLGRSSAEYGVWWMLPAVGYMIGNFISARVSYRHGIDRVIRGGIVVLILAGSLNVIWVFLASPDPNWLMYALFIPQILSTFGNGLIMPNTIAGAVSVRPQAAGAAAGIVGGIQMGCGAIISQMASIIIVHSETLLLLPIVAAVLSLGTLIPIALLARQRSREMSGFSISP